MPRYAALFRLLMVALATALAAGGAAAATATEQAFFAQLSTADQQEFQAWYTAQQHHERRLDAYWREVDRKRRERRAKRSATTLFEAADYVDRYPPEYRGPNLNPDLDRRWAQFREAAERAQPENAKKEIPGVADFLAAARQHYQFVPERVPEREFKRRYAEETLKLGLTKEQVVRVYALETGGVGTADMQAGIHPVSGKGKPISSALGYAQLLHANTIGELVKHGDEFIVRLKHLQQRDPSRAEQLQRKIASLQMMLKSARTVPNEWNKHVAFAQTSRGYGMHAINLDGDIGPWLQSLKLRGLKDFAARKGVVNMSSEEIELMNLSGPATGLEMMQPAGLTAPTPNFFSRRAYYVNKMVMGKTSAELLADFTRRMDNSSQKPGAIEFAQAFDEARQEKLPWR